MRIERIELLNFGSYEDLNVLDFTGGSEKQRIVVIGGKNGAGKTTLFTALQVCLYGYASFGYKTGGKRYLKEIYRLINNRARLDEGKRAHVKLCFSEYGVHTDRYELTRAWSWSGGLVEETLSITENGRSMDQEEVQDFQNYLLHLIPPELHKLYFFDGEKIADYFLDDGQTNLKEALLVLSGNDTYEILYRNLRRMLNAKEKDSGFSAEQYVRQKEEWEEYTRREQELIEAVSQINQEKERIEGEIAREKEGYAAQGGISLEEWKSLQHQLKEEEERRERLNQAQKAAAGEILPFLLVKDLLPAVRKQIDGERQLLSRRILRESLNTPQFKRRLTGAVKKTSSQDPASDAKLILESIQSFFEAAHPEEVQELFRISEDQSAAVLSAISGVEQFDGAFFASCRDEIAASVQRSQQIREQLKKSSIENYEEHLRKLSQWKSAAERLGYEKKRLEGELSALRGTISQAERTVKASRKALEAELKQRSMAELSERTLLLIGELQEQQYSKLLAAVERDLNQKFRQLMRKDDFVDHIYLGQDFSLHLVRSQAVEAAALLSTLRKHGVPALRKSLGELAYQALLDWLSAAEKDLEPALDSRREQVPVLPMEVDYTQFSNGEKQILVMSLYWAIMNQSRSELPFMIDTPFARIDTEHRANITERFFKELRGQLFVLSTNEELRQEHLAALKTQISKVYLLEYGEDKRTHIIEGNYFEV